MTTQNQAVLAGVGASLLALYTHGLPQRAYAALRGADVPLLNGTVMGVPATHTISTPDQSGWVIIAAFLALIYGVSFVDPTVALMLSGLAALDALLTSGLATKLGVAQ